MPSKSALLALEMGLGKSACAIKACDNLQAKNILIICPAFLRTNWHREYQLWSKENLRTQIIEKGMDIISSVAQIIIVSYDLIGKSFIPGCPGPILRQLLKLKFDVGIFDESHYLKELTSLRTRSVLLKGHLASRCNYKFFLTGTPILNRPIELYPILKACVPKSLDRYNTYKTFAQRYCGGHFNGFQYWDKGATNIEELKERLDFSGLMLRREKKDVLKELPEKSYQLIRLDPDGTLKKLMKEQESLECIEGMKFKAVKVDSARISQIRHALAIAKVPAAADFIRNALEQKEKIVVFVHHIAVIEKLKSIFYDLNPVVIYGKVPVSTRQLLVDRFQNNKACRLFIGQIQAAGIGITLTAADHVIFVEPSWVPGEINQAIDRVHRIGQKKSVTAQFLVVTDSLEEKMMKQVIEKIKVIKKLV